MMSRSYTLFHFCVTFLCIFVAISGADPSSTSSSKAVLITVDKSGHGDYSKIQDAIDSVPSGNTELVYILVKPGFYEEKVVVPEDKPFITVSGTKVMETIVSWNDSRDTYDSATFTVLAVDFVGRFLTIQNTFGEGAQAVASRVSGDRASFTACRFISHQDTLLDDIGRHFYSYCFIQGATDFICGNAASLFEKCHLHSVSEEMGSITAQRRESPAENTGFIFLGCKITGMDKNKAMLGRPWGAYSRVVFANTYMSSVISPPGWDDWQDPSKQRTVYYGEYKNYGRGAKSPERVPWSLELTSQQVAPFLSKDWIGAKDWIRPLPTNFKRGFTASPTPNLNGK